VLNKSAPQPPPQDSTPPVVSQGGFCVVQGPLPAGVEYYIIRKLEVGKGSYGSFKGILPKLIEEARHLGADAIIEYTGSQRFGLWPWRIVRPVVTGTAVRWASPAKIDCKAVGGSLH